MNEMIDVFIPKHKGLLRTFLEKKGPVMSPKEIYASFACNSMEIDAPINAQTLWTDDVIEELNDDKVAGIMGG